MRRIVTALFGVFVFAGSIVAQTGSFQIAKDYTWPTNASEFASASFGETRAAHFHAALDVKTWGREGFRVYATRDGILHRLGISHRGYGKVVYLKHDDGSYSIYAHLQRFIRDFQALADSIRFKDFRFQIDHNFEDLGIRVKQGDIIGYTGSSGVGPPHLHFELRTPTESPFNPLHTNLSIPDRRAPRFSGIAVEPMDAGTEIEGQRFIYTKKARPRKGGFSFGTITVNGPISGT